MVEPGSGEPALLSGRGDRRIANTRLHRRTDRQIVMTPLEVWRGWGDAQVESPGGSGQFAPSAHASSFAPRSRGHRGSPSVMSGHREAIEGTLAAIFSGLTGHQPGSGSDEHPETLYVIAAALLSAGRITGATRLLRRLDALTAFRSDSQRWRGRSEYLWALHADQTGDVPGVLEHCAASTRAIGSVHGPGEPDPPDASGSLSLVQTIDAVALARLPVLAARAHVGLGDPEGAQAVLEERYHSVENAATHQPGILAMVACRQGRLSDALQLATTALRRMPEHDSGSEFVDLEARLVLAGVFYERNDLRAAQQHLDAALHVACVTGARTWIWAVEIDAARLLLAQQDAEGAAYRLAHVRRVQEAGSLPQPLAEKLNRVEIDCRLHRGDVEGALLIAKSSPPEALSCETLARLDLHRCRPDQALARLRSARPARLPEKVRRLVLSAFAESQQGRRSRAIGTLRRAVEATRSEGCVRPFLAEPARALPLLRGMDAYSSDPFLARLVREVELVAPPATSSGGAGPLESLSEREMEVLRYLSSHLSLRQISDCLIVSPNTVKTHVMSIYRKMGVNSRHEAVTMSLQHGLV